MRFLVYAVLFRVTAVFALREATELADSQTLDKFVFRDNLNAKISYDDVLLQRNLWQDSGVEWRPAQARVIEYSLRGKSLKRAGFFGVRTFPVRL
jgi:hypothetical protein